MVSGFFRILFPGFGGCLEGGGGGGGASKPTSISIPLEKRGQPRVQGLTYFPNKSGGLQSELLSYTIDY